MNNYNNFQTIWTTWLYRVFNYYHVIEEIKRETGNNYIYGFIRPIHSSFNYWKLSKYNAIITKFIYFEPTIFLGNPVSSDKIFLMISDATAYMLKAFSNVKVLYEHVILLYMFSTCNQLCG